MRVMVVVVVVVVVVIVGTDMKHIRIHYRITNILSNI